MQLIDWQLAETEHRWERESAYFDAQEYAAEPIPPAVIERYRNCVRPYLAAEYPFWRLGDVRGKRILDVGCGNGTNALMLALKGAHVVGIDLSSRAIESAEMRARLHQLGDRARFICGPLETELQNESSFDIITGFAVLHHLLPVLNKFLTEITRHGNEHTEYLFVEPVNLSPWLRRVRLAMPISVSGTPDERPIQAAELDLVRDHFGGIEIEYFHGFARFAERFLLRGIGYETASWWRRVSYCSASRLDRILFEQLNLVQLSSVAVICARTGRIDPSGIAPVARH
jgi:SAM-dependent methyltransferase